MPFDSICLFPELKEIDPALYADLERWDLQADQSQGQTAADGCLDSDDIATLKGLGVLSDTNLAPYQRQFQFYRETWDSLPASGREIWLKAVQDRPLVRELLDGINPLNFDAVKKKFVAVVESGQKQPEDLPWLVHVYYHTFLDYVASDEPRLLPTAIAQGIYDCTEYTEGMQEILEVAGINSTAVVFAISGENKHAFLAYEVDNRWGFASVMSFEPPVHPSRNDILRLWEGQASNGVFIVGQMKNGGLENASIASY